MQRKNLARTVKFSAQRVGLWMFLALLAWIALTGCAAAAEPRQSSPGQASSELYQGPPPTGTLEVIQVDVNAIEIDPQHRRGSESCKRLHSPLLQVVESADPAQTAQALGLPVRENQVQVSLLLDGSDTAFLERAGIEVATQVGQEIQAFVPIPKLCELAAHENVLAIRPVDQAETQ